MKQRRAEWYERRTRKKEEKEEEEAGNVHEDIVVQGGDVTSARSSKITETANPVRPKTSSRKEKDGGNNSRRIQGR